MSRVALPPLTAILTCRNAAGTLPRLLDHLQRAGATVVLIDHGSTDGTKGIASARRGAPVSDMISMPFDGIFDLTEQLRLKAEVIGSVGEGWILHADADEFLDAPSGATLRAFAARWDAEGRIAIPCQEFLFLPADEAENHGPADFPETLTTYVHLAERDPKQRLFRHDARLDLWRATGGHTVTLDPALIAPEPVDLRHYLGLSLDDIRAQYYGRVFAVRDLAKRWHSHRRTGSSYHVAAPSAGILKDSRTDGLDISEPWQRPPVFLPAPRPAAGPPFKGTDLLVVGAESPGSREVLAVIGDAFPGLRIGLLQDADLFPAVRMPAPVLHLVEHPSALADDVQDRDARRDLAVAWVRRVAAARQMALGTGVGYRELRVEDGLQEPGLAAVVRGLILGSGTRGAEGFLSANPTQEAGESADPVAVIAGPLARDLGYLLQPEVQTEAATGSRPAAIS